VRVRILRLLKIIRVSLRFGLDEFLLGHERVRALRAAVSMLLFWRDLRRAHSACATRWRR
jgi:ubiquinone biosynthesis protein